MSLGRLISKVAPSSIQLSLTAKSIRKWSAAKGHSLSFDIELN
jgi:hypothetical protein